MLINLTNVINKGNVIIKQLQIVLFFTLLFSALFSTLSNTGVFSIFDFFAYHSSDLYI